VTTPFSFIASANCVLCERDSGVRRHRPRLNIDPALVEAAITPRTKAILPAHIFGYPAELDELEAIAERHGLAIVEDAAEAWAPAMGGPSAIHPSSPSTPTSR
jgi:dTDP-4-amino-4,6-dideoxygalactose transaminase